MQVRLAIPTGIHQIVFEVKYRSHSNSDIKAMIYDIEVAPGICIDLCMYTHIVGWNMKVNNSLFKHELQDLIE